MLLLSCVLGWLSDGPSARADSVVFASSEPRTMELLPELTLSLRGHGVLLIARTLGDARTPLERAASAQRIGRNVGAGATLWIEREPPMRVRAVSASGEHILEAPLPQPIERIDPGLFASVATSLALEALGRTGSAQAVPPHAAPVEAALAPIGPQLPPVAPVRAPHTRPLALWQRLFFRAGLTAASVYLKRGATADRSAARVLDRVASDSRSSTADGSLDLTAAKRELQALGYDCSVQAVADALRVGPCGAAVGSPGFHTSLAIDLAAGVRLMPRLALALTARVAPNAGLGALAHALFGLQLELALLRPRTTGFWLNSLAGLGVGRIQALGGPAREGAPYATSGLGNARVGVQLGYRFTPNIGVYAGPVFQAGFPAHLYALDTSAGLEARL